MSVEERVEHEVDVSVRPGFEWEMAHFLLAAEAFDSYHSEMGVDSAKLIPARSHLRAMVRDFEWPVDEYPPDERGWELTRTLFSAEEVSGEFKSWYYTWVRNVALSLGGGRRERFLFPVFLVFCPPEIDESSWCREVIRPTRHHSLKLSSQIKGMRGKLDDWIPRSLQQRGDEDTLDLPGFAAYTLKQWRLRVAMQEVLWSLSDDEIARIDELFREFCKGAEVLPRPISCVFDRGLRNGAFRAHYGLRV